MCVINVVVCVYNSDLDDVKRRVTSFFRFFDCKVNVLICYTGYKECVGILEEHEIPNKLNINFEVTPVENTLMDIGAYYSGFKKLQNNKNITIFMNDRFLLDFNTTLFSLYLRRDLPTLKSMNVPVLYGKINILKNRG